MTVTKLQTCQKIVAKGIPKKTKANIKMIFSAIFGSIKSVIFLTNTPQEKN